jgi:DNA helicase HerA-like ATPase
MSDQDQAGVYLGQSTKAETLLFRRTNRHGVVAGATGTGKTVTLQIMAQGFADAGVPGLCRRCEGRSVGICQIGTPNEKLLARAQQMDWTLVPEAAPDDLLGPVWSQGSPDPHHHVGGRPAVAGPDAGAERRPGRRSCR